MEISRMIVIKYKTKNLLLKIIKTSNVRFQIKWDKSFVFYFR